MCKPQLASTVTALSQLDHALCTHEKDAKKLQLTPPIVSGNMTLLEANVDALARFGSIRVVMNA